MYAASVWHDGGQLAGSRSGGDRLAGSMIVEAPDGVLLPAFGTNGTSVPDVCCVRLAVQIWFASLWLHPLCSGGVSLA